MFNSAFLKDLARIARSNNLYMETAEEKTAREKAAADAAAARPPIVPKNTAENSSDLVDRIVSRYGSERSALNVLADENFQYRDRHREDTDELKRLRPLVLTAEQHKDYQEYVKLGVPAELKTKVEKLPELERQALEHNERDHYLNIGQATGMKPNILQDLAKNKGFTIELRTEKVDGEDEKVAYAKGSEKDAQFIKLDDYIEKHLKDYAPSLKAEDASDKSAPIVPFLRQPQPTTKGKAPKEGDVAKNYLNQAYATPGQLADRAAK